MTNLVDQTNQRNTITIIAAPTSRRFNFTARIEGADRYLVTSTYQPLLDGARRLLDLGYDPSLTLVMKHEGSSTEALRSTIGKAAKLTVEECRDGVPRFRPYRPRPSAGAPPIRLLSARATRDQLHAAQADLTTGGDQ